MSVGEWGLIAGVVFAGLWSGLLAMLTLVLHPMMAAMDGPGFARYLHGFLPIARKAPVNSICIFGMVIAAAVALFDLSGTPLVLDAIALALAIAGPLVVSSRFSEPNYDVMLGWDPDRIPEGWEAIRRRYFALDWIRAVATWTAFGLFLAALVVEL